MYYKEEGFKINESWIIFFFFPDKESALQRLSKQREAELKYQSEQNSLDVSKAKEMAAIETDKFQNMVSSIGADTIQAIATAGPEMQVRVTMEKEFYLTYPHWSLLREFSQGNSQVLYFDHWTIAMPL